MPSRNNKNQSKPSQVLSYDLYKNRFLNDKVCCPVPFVTAVSLISTCFPKENLEGRISLFQNGQKCGAKVSPVFIIRLIHNLEQECCISKEELEAYDNENKSGPSDDSRFVLRVARLNSFPLLLAVYQCF